MKMSRNFRDILSERSCDSQSREPIEMGTRRNASLPVGQRCCAAVTETMETRGVRPSNVFGALCFISQLCVAVAKTELEPRSFCEFLLILSSIPSRGFLASPRMAL